MVTATFLTEDSYLGSLTEPLTLNRYNYCVSSYLNYTDPSGNSTENDVDRILREYPILSNQKSEQAIAVESFVNGVLGSAAKVIIDKPTAAYMPGMAMEELYGGQYRFNERAYNNYVNLTETLIEALSKDATNKTAYYAGRCTGDVVITVVGGVEFVYGLITTISGGSGSAAALATGIGIAAEPVTIAVTAEGVVTVVDGVNTIHYGITAFKKDADKGKEAKEADSKAAESGSSSRYDRTGYQSKGRSNNLFGRDRSTRRTTNLTEWRRSISQQDIHNEMRLFLGDDYVKIDSGKWRSLDGTRQFRVKPDDYLGNHGIGQPTVPNTPHVHFEFLTPKSNGNGFDVIKNIHVPIK